MAARPPLRLFWWRKTPNFGDGISPLIVAHASGRQVVHADPDEAELFALGSILRPVAKSYRAPRRHRPVVWGAGCMKPVGRRFTAHVDFAALRGPKTAEVLHVAVEAYGDPGLLIGEVLGEDIKNGEEVAVVPHFSHVDLPVWRALAERPGLRLVDVRASDPLEAVRQIAGARHVFSSSLHGLVTADAYGIPSTWVDPEGIHAEPYFKFNDYALGIDRNLGKPIQPEEIPARLPDLPEGPLPHAAGIAAAKQRLWNSFPPALRAN
ncbi:polysaccharide pyruvyl transferase family protein [Poseidonocella sp. HB161398]|uniref:polysaccharide pyruvyl transferase family protein n=1 Tax=Poseidonocella sp. HB161398 TaxID=2320855 RepID=UPI00110911DB|nr:polysaccharide pyruvyl transferase family protein [Poseidonocella sp. HB161398]